MKKVDRAWLKEYNACPDGYKFWCEHCEGQDTEQQLLTLVDYRSDWAWWVLTRLLTIEQNRKLAVFAAKEVLPIFEKEYPKDMRPQKAIEAAEKVIECNIGENRAAARAAADAARAAADAAWSAEAASAWAARAARAAARAAADARSAAAAWAAYGAADAAWAVGYAADAWDAMKMKIMKYGLTLLEEDLDI